VGCKVSIFGCRGRPSCYSANVYSAVVEDVFYFYSYSGIRLNSTSNRCCKYLQRTYPLLMQDLVGWRLTLSQSRLPIWRLTFRVRAKRYVVMGRSCESHPIEALGLSNDIGVYTSGSLSHQDSQSVPFPHLNLRASQNQTCVVSLRFVTVSQ
jgi:hypothetical protein